MSEWISVKDRLPDAYEDVLVYATAANKCSWVIVIDCIGPAGEFGLDSSYLRVTHWMPLPEPPKER